MTEQLPYEKHRREYTMVGMTATFQQLFRPETIEFLGAKVEEWISVVKNGEFYHVQRTGERDNLSKGFLGRISHGELTFEKLEEEYQKLDENMVKFEALMERPISAYDREMILELHRIYQEVIALAVMGADSADFVNELPEEMRPRYLKWITKVRRRAEILYKDGEMKLMPRYLEWLARTHLADYSAEQLSYLFYEEMQNYIKKGASLPSRKELNERQKSLYVRQYPVDQYQLLSGRAAEEVFHKMGIFKQRDDLRDLAEFKGQTAYQGKAKGHVRIVRSRYDMKYFEDDEVLVTTMTDPSYLPIMKRAAAFVTNEGGTLCHAAIVARELHKPCVIGTRFATHALHDGDYIEVDGLEGIVKILERSQPKAKK